MTRELVGLFSSDTPPEDIAAAILQAIDGPTDDEVRADNDQDDEDGIAPRDAARPKQNGTREFGA